jgi:hypothetical protein
MHLQKIRQHFAADVYAPYAGGVRLPEHERHHVRVPKVKCYSISQRKGIKGVRKTGIDDYAESGDIASRYIMRRGRGGTCPVRASTDSGKLLEKERAASDGARQQA